VSVKRIIYSRQWFDTLISRWPTVGRLAYTIVWLVNGHALLHPSVIDMLSHCRQYGRHRQHECQRRI